MVKWKYKYKNHNGKNSLEHRVIAERALGHPLPPGAGVHHVDGNCRNNDHANLVIYPSMSYHRLLHKRQRAFDACGHAGWLKCRICKRWEDPKKLLVYEYPQHGMSISMHAACNSAKLREKRKCL